MKKISILALVIICCAAARAADIIPKPVSVESGSGTFLLTPDTQINFWSAEAFTLADYLGGYLRVYPTMYSSALQAPVTNVIDVRIDHEAELPAEGYRLRVTDNSVEIRGKDYGGLFNGIQTFLQLLPPEVYDKRSPLRNFCWPVEGVVIEDYPRFDYRGVMLDVARTFVPKEDVMRFIDKVAYHKINKLHWHLADDEGWRIEIERYPELHQTGGFRGGDSPVKPIYGAWDRRYGGYYTQDEIREVVAYAAIRNIEIIPEIDLPGHSRAAAIAHPEILCDYTPNLTPTAGYDRRNVWCVAKEENYRMLSHILEEMAAMFPSGTIHLGGDEVEPAQWTHCPDCKALVAAKGITDAAALEDVFMERAVAIADSLGKKAGVWNEAVANGKLDRSVTAYGWKNVAACRKAAAAGYPTVVMPGKFFYFDMRQSPNERGHIWAGIVSPETVYRFDFAKEGFTDAEMENVRGVEGAFFSELLLPNGLDYLDYQMFPRVCALSELTWSESGARDWDDFSARLDNSHYARMTAMGIGYRTPPTSSPAPQAAKLTPAVTFTSNLKEQSKWPFGNVSSYKNVARTSVTCRRGDWFLWTFDSPVDCQSVRVATGYAHLQRAGVPAGYVEASYDGKTFERAGELHDGGECTFRPRKGLHAVRVVSETDGNGEPFVIVQPLEIR